MKTKWFVLVFIILFSNTLVNAQEYSFKTILENRYSGITTQKVLVQSIRPSGKYAVVTIDQNGYDIIISLLNSKGKYQKSVKVTIPAPASGLTTEKVDLVGIHQKGKIYLTLTGWYTVNGQSFEHPVQLLFDEELNVSDAKFDIISDTNYSNTVYTVFDTDYNDVSGNSYYVGRATVLSTTPNKVYMYVAKLDYNGTIIWAKALPELFPVYGIEVNANDELFIYGTSKLRGTGINDSLKIVKLSPAGNVLFNKQYSPNKNLFYYFHSAYNNQLNRLCLSSQRAELAQGSSTEWSSYYYTFDGTTGEMLQNNYYYTDKTYYPYLTGPVFNGVVASPQDSSWVFLMNNVNPISPFVDNKNVGLMKVDHNGNVVFNAMYDNDDSSFTFLGRDKLSATFDEGFVMAGYRKNSNNQTSVFINKLRSDGNMQCASRNTLTFEKRSDNIVTVDAGPIITYDLNDTFKFLPVTTSPVTLNSSIVCLDSAYTHHGLGYNSIVKKNIGIEIDGSNILSQNEILRLKLSNVSSAKFIIYNSYGQKMTNGELKEGANAIDIAGYMPGMYIVKSQYMDEDKSLKFIVH